MAHAVNFSWELSVRRDISGGRYSRTSQTEGAWAIRKSPKSFKTAAHYLLFNQKPPFNFNSCMTYESECQRFDGTNEKKIDSGENRKRENDTVRRSITGIRKWHYVPFVCCVAQQRELWIIQVLPDGRPFTAAHLHLTDSSFCHTTDSSFCHTPEQSEWLKMTARRMWPLRRTPPSF